MSEHVSNAVSQVGGSDRPHRGGGGQLHRGLKIEKLAAVDTVHE